jgi:hypothetical protein
MAWNDVGDEDEEEDMEEGPLLAVGFELALIAVGTQGGHEVAVYDYEKCVRILMKRDAMERNEAVEFMDYNVLCAWMGERTPVFITR